MIVPSLVPLQVAAVVFVVNVTGIAESMVTEISVSHVVLTSVIVIMYVPEGTPENTFPVRTIEGGLGLIL